MPCAFIPSRAAMNDERCTPNSEYRSRCLALSTMSSESIWVRAIIQNAMRSSSEPDVIANTPSTAFCALLDRILR